MPNVRVHELFSKRILGYINWRHNRAGALSGNLVDVLVAAVARLAPDHVAVTGDLVNLALKAEMAPARRFLERLGGGGEVTVVPGNHDAYVPGADRRVEAAWGAWMAGDDTRSGRWPFLRRRGPLTLIGLTTAKPTGPFMATGTIGLRQAADLEAALKGLAGDDGCRVLLIHHPPFEGAAHWHKRLVDAGHLREIVARHGVDLVLHGHTHLPTRTVIAGPGGADVPVIGVPAALQRPGGRRPASGFNVIDVERHAGRWRIDIALHQFDPARGAYVETERMAIERPAR